MSQSINGGGGGLVNTAAGATEIVGMRGTNTGDGSVMLTFITMRKALFCLIFCLSPVNLSADDLSPWAGLNHPESVEVIEHAPWNAILAGYIEEKAELHYFHYAKVTPQDKARLARYIESLSQVQVTRLARDEQFAFWVNLYNALTIHLILDHYPVNSIKEISFGQVFGLGFFDFLGFGFGLGPWDEPLVRVDGRSLSLNDIEHKILRTHFKDPRIHYVVNCASIGCPNLPRVALTSANLQAQLNLAAVQFINHERAVLVGNDGLLLSKIYDWYFSDFAQDEEQLIAHLHAYAYPPLQEKLRGVRRIADFHYDWRLNELAGELAGEALQEWGAN